MTNEQNSPAVAGQVERRVRRGRLIVNKEEQEEEIQTAFAEFAVEYPQSALALIIGMFVGLLEYSVEDQGGDKNMDIKIEGGNRCVTVHAVTHNAEVTGAAPTNGERSDDF